MGKNNKQHKGDFRFMIGVLDNKTHTNMFYAKNLNLPSLESVFKELKKKYK